MQHPLTLLAAPAGFGKTALLSAWARERQRSLAWVSLDPDDGREELLSMLDAHLSEGDGPWPRIVFTCRRHKG